MNTKAYRTVPAFILSFLFLFSFLSSSVAEETRIVSLRGGASYSTNSIKIEPETLQINQGSVVVWNNWVKSSEVRIVFEEGKVCQDVTEAPTGFTLDAKQCYVTTWTPLGGTSSLRFTQPGKFKYIVEASKGVSANGTIHVQWWANSSTGKAQISCSVFVGYWFSMALLSETEYSYCQGGSQ